MMETKTNTTRTILRSDELSCPSCVSGIEKALIALSGVEAAKVHFNTGRLEIEHDPTMTTVITLVETVKKAGYTAYPSPF